MGLLSQMMLRKNLINTNNHANSVQMQFIDAVLKLHCATICHVNPFKPIEKCCQNIVMSTNGAVITIKNQNLILFK